MPAPATRACARSRPRSAASGRRFRSSAPMAARLRRSAAGPPEHFRRGRRTATGRRAAATASAAGPATTPTRRRRLAGRRSTRRCVRRWSISTAVPAPAGEMDGGARPRLARHPAARGDRPWAGRRLQPQEDLRLRRTARPAHRVARASPWSMTAPSTAAAAR